MKKKSILQRLASWLEVILLIPGAFFISYGAFQIYVPAGYITIGCCFTAAAVIYGLIHPEGK